MHNSRPQHPKAKTLTNLFFCLLVFGRGSLAFSWSTYASIRTNIFSGAELQASLTLYDIEYIFTSGSDWNPGGQGTAAGYERFTTRYDLLDLVRKKSDEKGSWLVLVEGGYANLNSSLSSSDDYCTVACHSNWEAGHHYSGIEAALSIAFQKKSGFRFSLELGSVFLKRKDFFKSKSTEVLSDEDLDEIKKQSEWGSGYRTFLFGIGWEI